MSGGSEIRDPFLKLRLRYAVILVTTAMGLVANMSLMTALAGKVPESTCGFLAFLFIIVGGLRMDPCPGPRSSGVVFFFSPNWKPHLVGFLASELRCVN